MKEAWRLNVPYVVAYMTELRARMEPDTPEGRYNSTLAMTDDEAAAQRAMTEFRAKQLEAALKARPPRELG